MSNRIIEYFSKKEIGNRPLKFIGGLAIMVNTLSTSIFGVQVGNIMNIIISKDITSLYKALLHTLLILLLGLISGLIGWIAAYLHSTNKLKNIKNNIYQYELSKKREETIDISNFSTKIDMVFNDNFLSRWHILSNMSLFIFSIIATIYIDWRMLIIAFISSLIPLVTPMFFSKNSKKVSTDYTESSESYIEKVDDTLKGRLEIIKYNVMSNYKELHEKNNHNLENKRFTYKSFMYATKSFTELTGSVSFLLIFLFGGYFSIKGSLEPGSLLGVVQLMNYMVFPIVNISTLRSEIIATTPILEELESYTIEEEYKYKIKIENVDKVNLDIEHLYFKYENSDKYVIEDFTYQFKPNQKYLIRGSSGVGKTTLCKLLSGELKPESGSVLINNNPINNLKALNKNNIIKYVDQQSYIFKDTIYNNIDLYREMPKDKIINLLNILGLNELDYNLLVHDSAGVSGGQKSRINLARSLCEPAPILIFDEPTASLDYETSLSVMKYLTNLPVTIIVVSHSSNAEEIELFDEIIEI